MKKIVILIFSLLSVGCMKKEEVLTSLLVDERPPLEILKSLDSINSVQDLSLQEHYNYIFTRAVMNYRLRQIHADDTLLKNVADYFEKNNELEKNAFLLLCIGQAFRVAELYEQADLNYLEAENRAATLTDKMLLLCIFYERGCLYAKLEDKEGALQMFDKMKSLVTRVSKLKSNLESSYPYLNVIDALLYLGEYEKATEWYNIIYNHMMYYADSATVSSIVYKLAYSLYKQEHMEASQYFIRRSLEYSKTKETCLKNLLLLAEIYYKENNIDMLENILIKVPNYLTSENLKDQEIYYWLLGELYCLKGESSKALEMLKLYNTITDSTWVKKSQLQLKYMEQKFKQMKSEAEILELYHQNAIIVIICILVLILIGSIALIFYRQLLRQRRLCVEEEDFIHGLNILLENNKAKLQELLECDLYRTQQLSKIKAMPSQANDDFLKRYYQLFYKDTQSEFQKWEKIYFAVNFLYDNFKDNLVTAYPLLSVHEVNLCCLLRVGFDTNAIAFVMNQSIYTIHKRKTMLRKKFNMADGADIIIFLLKMM